MNKVNVFKAWHKYVNVKKTKSDCVIPHRDTEVPADIFLEYKEIPFERELARENSNLSQVSE